MDVIVGTVVKNVMIRPAYQEYIMLSTKEAGKGRRVAGMFLKSKILSLISIFDKDVVYIHYTSISNMHYRLT